jgi:hypothetical protein
MGLDDRIGVLLQAARLRTLLDVYADLLNALGPWGLR